MKSKNVLFVGAICIALLLVFGCVNQQGNSFVYGTDFNASVGKAYASQDNNMVIRLVSITDSRCPQDAQCIWAGELGAQIELIKNAGETNTLFLGMTTNPEDVEAGVEIKLVAVYPDTNAVQLIVKQNATPVTGGDENAWFSIQPKQCQSNEWNAYQVRTGIKFKLEPGTSMDRALIPIWLKEDYNILILESASRQVSDFVCEACSCGTGEEIAVKVSLKELQKMHFLGFNYPPLIACTKEAKICSDGSAVGRTEPFCEFEKCPILQEPTELLIEKTDYPGFVINPTTTITTIRASGAYDINITERNYDENKQVWVETNSKKSGQLDTAQLTELKNTINNSNFFELTQEDLRTCIADAPTVGLNITMGEKTNSLVDLGAECDKNKTTQLYEISNLITSYTSAS